MRKVLTFSLVFIIFTGPLAETVRASALEQWYYWLSGNQLMLVQQQNLDMLDALKNQGRRSRMRRLADDAVFDGSTHWVPGQQGYGYPALDRRGKPLGRGERLENYVVLTSAGAMIGGAAGGRNGALIGGGTGLLGSWIYNQIRGKKVYVSDPAPMPMPRGRGVSEQQEHGQEGPYSPPGYLRRAEDFPVVMENLTGTLIEVFDGVEGDVEESRFVGKMRAGARWPARLPDFVYWARAPILSENGVIFAKAGKTYNKPLEFGFIIPSYVTETARVKGQRIGR